MEIRGGYSRGERRIENEGGIGKFVG